MDNAEVTKILKLVADGKISPEQGTDLLGEFVETYGTTGSRRKFNIEVFNMNSGKIEANIKLPVKLASFVGNFIKEKDANFKIGNENIDMNIKEVLEEVIKTGESVEIEADGRRITIRIED